VIKYDIESSKVDFRNDFPVIYDFRSFSINSNNDRCIYMVAKTFKLSICPKCGYPNISTGKNYCTCRRCNKRYKFGITSGRGEVIMKETGEYPSREMIELQQKIIEGRRW